MLDFRAPTLEDKERIDSFINGCGQSGCDVTFVNTYLWRDHFSVRVAFDEDSYYKCYCVDGKVSGYSLPITRGDLKTAVDKVIADARERGAEPMIGLLNDENAALIQRLYEGHVTVLEDRDSFDYIYERAHLAELAGKKYHAKRNHIARFMRTYGERHRFEVLCERNLCDALDIAERWQAHNADTGELAIIRDALDHFDQLGLFGLILYVNDVPCAMCIASRISDTMCDVGFEKAVDVDGAYAVINNEFAKRFDRFTYINREEDMGLDGLRKSKLSYHPDILYKKSYAVFS